MRSGQSRAQAIREEKREEVLLSLRNRGLIQQVVESAEKLANLTEVLDSTEVSRIKAANDARLSLIKKYLPDLKAVESTHHIGESAEEWLSQLS